MRLTDRDQDLGGRPGSSLDSSDLLRSPTAVLPRAPGQAWVEERTRVAVSRNINVSGRLVFQEAVRIEGRFRGEISSIELVVVSEEGFVEGRIRTPRVLILGELQGDIVGSRSVVLGPRARVAGKIETVGLTICEGARFDGDVRIVHADEPAPNG